MPKYIIFWCIALFTISACTQSVARDVSTATPLPTMTPVLDTPVLPSPTAVASMPPQATARATATATASANLDTQTGVTAEGYYAFGSDQAPVTFVDYSDYF